MRTLGAISDTHGLLRPQALVICHGADDTSPSTGGTGNSDYLRYRGEKDVSDGKPWETIVLEDFAEMLSEPRPRAQET
jgi:hypothetical protein